MNWEAIGAIAELLGAVGVSLSLVYLAVQVRHNSYLRWPGAQAWWKVRKVAYTQEFQRFLEGSEPPPAPIRTTEQLRTGVHGLTPE